MLKNNTVIINLPNKVFEQKQRSKTAFSKYKVEISKSALVTQNSCVRDSCFVLLLKFVCEKKKNGTNAEIMIELIKLDFKTNITHLLIFSRITKFLKVQ